MESLLSVSFDNISSRNTNKSSKGLRQIEGLLAQICLSPRSPPSTIPPKPSSASSTLANNISIGFRPLRVLADDLAFQEFFRLQESFEWNVGTRLIECLERLLGMRSAPPVEDLIRSTLNLLQGALLLHPPSRTLFSRENHMNLLLDLLDPNHASPPTLASALLVLTTSLLDHPINTRLFESLDGINTVASLWKKQNIDVSSKSGGTSVVETLCREFLAFYLMPEAPSTPTFALAPLVATSPADRTQPSSFPDPYARSPSRSTSKQSCGSGSVVTNGGSTRTAEEKRKILSKCLDSHTERALAKFNSTQSHDSIAA